MRLHCDGGRFVLGKKHIKRDFPFVPRLARPRVGLANAASKQPGTSAASTGNYGNPTAFTLSFALNEVFVWGALLLISGSSFLGAPIPWPSPAIPIDGKALDELEEHQDG